VVEKRNRPLDSERGVDAAERIGGESTTQSPRGLWALTLPASSTVVRYARSRCEGYSTTAAYAAVSTLMAGPWVVEMVIERMYVPLAVAGLSFMS